MGDFKHGHIQWKSVESTGGDDQQFLFLIQESFLTQHVLEPTMGENVSDVLDLVLSSQKELVDNVKIHEPLGNSDHNQIHFVINVKSESKNKKTCSKNFHKGNYKDMRNYLNVDKLSPPSGKPENRSTFILQVTTVRDRLVSFNLLQKPIERCIHVSTII